MDAGTRQFFATAVERTTARLFGTALRLTRNRSDAEELVAETVAKAWARLPELRDRQCFEAWIQRILANFGKDSLKEGDFGSAPQWSLMVEKKQNRSFYIQKFLLDVDAKAKAEIKAEVTVNGQNQEQKKTPEEEKASKEMDEQLKPLILSIVRVRFVFHTPSPIVDSNADIVLSSNTAVWNCSLAAFTKEKKAIELKATY